MKEGGEHEAGMRMALTSVMLALTLLRAHAFSGD